jgi:hypothetical protein
VTLGTKHKANPTAEVLALEGTHGSSAIKRPRVGPNTHTLVMSSSLAMDPAGVNSIEVTKRPVGFLDLPPEVRTMVYKLALPAEQQELVIDTPRPSWHGGKFPTIRGFARSEWTGGTAPSLLQVSSLVRREATPVYARGLTVHVYTDLKGQKEIWNMLAGYLEFSRSLVVHDFDCQSNDYGAIELILPYMPALKMLHLSKDLAYSPRGCVMFTNSSEWREAFERHVQRFKSMGMRALEGAAVPPGVLVFAKLDYRGAYMGRIGRK